MLGSRCSVPPTEGEGWYVVAAPANAGSWWSTFLAMDRYIHVSYIIEHFFLEPLN